MIVYMTSCLITRHRFTFVPLFRHAYRAGVRQCRLSLAARLVQTVSMRAFVSAPVSLALRICGSVTFPLAASLDHVFFLA